MAQRLEAALRRPADAPIAPPVAPEPPPVRPARSEAPAPAPTRGWYKLYADHVQQAHLGADLDVLVGSSGSDVPRDSH